MTVLFEWVTALLRHLNLAFRQYLANYSQNPFTKGISWAHSVLVTIIMFIALHYASMNA